MPFIYRLDDLTKLELESLADWERTFEAKYEVVGQVRFREPRGNRLGFLSTGYAGERTFESGVKRWGR